MTDEHRSPSQLNEWRPVKGYEGIYEVSSLGFVRSLDRVVKHFRGGTASLKGKHIKCSIGKTGYRQISLRRDGGSWTTKVHRLVAQAFLGDPPIGMVVCHRDGDSLNNISTNLYYGTALENAQDRIKHGNSPRENTCCSRGHDFTEANTYLDSDGHRSCKTCRRDSSKRFRERNNAT